MNLQYYCLKTIKVKKITSEILRDFIAQNPIELKSTHSKLCLPIINRLYRKMSIGIKFSNIKVANSLIIDGHHRYIASLLAKSNLNKVKSNLTSAIEIIDWSLVDFVEEDWDTQAKINMFNEIDAKFNEIPLEKIIELLK